MALDRGDGGGRSTTAASGRRGSGGSFAKKGWTGGASKRPAPTRNTSNTKSGGGARPAATSKQVLGGGGGTYDLGFGGGSGGGFAPMGAPAPAPAPAAPTEEDYLAGDAGYKAQLASLMKALSMYTADDTAQRTRYETDYGDALKNLGWTPDNAETEDVNESAWNWEDQNTASGRANQNQLNDFASRGMLQSSGYARANNDLQRSFNDQLGGVNRARTDFLGQRDRDLSAYKNENTSASQQARAEALARRAAQYGL